MEYFSVVNKSNKQFSSLIWEDKHTFTQIKTFSVSWTMHCLLGMTKIFENKQMISEGRHCFLFLKAFIVVLLPCPHSVRLTLGTEPRNTR